MKSSIRISNSGRTIRATGVFANELFKAMTESVEEPPKPKDRVSKVNDFTGPRWRCPECGHIMTEEESKGYRGCPTGFHAAQHVRVEA